VRYSDVQEWVAEISEGQSATTVLRVQRMLGHASAAMTLDVYADLFDDDLDLVANRLNEGLGRADVGRRLL
jgi:integrase